MGKAASLLLVACILVGCDGGGSGDQGGGNFRLIEFLENNQADIARNHAITFLFSGLVRPDQDLSQRLKIQNVHQEPGSDFTLAIGTYIVTGDRVTFNPRLPNLVDRSDAGYRADGNYIVFLKGGPDALESLGGDRITSPQEFSFVTNQFFEDIVPGQPPRALGFVARDLTTNGTVDLSRLDPRPSEVALMDSAELIAGDRFINPGAGAAPNFTTRWQFELSISEPLDPVSVSTDTIQMFEIFSDATTSAAEAAPAAPPGHMGTAVQFPVPLNVGMQQGLNAQGQIETRILIVPIYTLVDDTRYRITFSGTILGLDFRKEFIGENGLTGDGQTVLSGATPYPEPGGLGYTTEFIVRDRAAITQKRTLTYDPLVDGIQPELGQTVADEDRYNSALYNPTISPSTAVGFLSAFGQGTDGNLAVSSGTLTIDTGDTVNPTVSSFQVFDLNPNDQYHQNTLPGGIRTYTNPEPFELQLESLTVSTGATLRFVGKNPPILRVRSIAQVAGTIDIAGGDGQQGGGTASASGTAGAGGFIGGNGKKSANCFTYCPGGANDFIVFLNACAAAKASEPHALNGQGPGRGYAGGTAYTYDYQNDLTVGGGTGGGGGAHATQGGVGEDLKNIGGAPGTGGNPCDTWCGIRPDGVIGVRGQSGPTYGDRELAVILLGGSGGGAGGGDIDDWNNIKGQAGGSGGGGGGSISIVAAGAILVGSGGVIDASGGDGGRGRIVTLSAPNSWYGTSGGGGGGAGGSISLISGDTITVTGGLLDARGGLGGPRSDVGTSLNCNACNAGGAGGKGYIFLMDADGQIAGLIPGTAGNHDTYANGVLTISQFDATRFSSIAAVTELFPALTADPAYQPLAPLDILGLVNPNQRIRIFASSAKADTDDPLIPDITTETAQFEVALVRQQSGATTVDIVPGAMAQLNPAGMPARDAFVRIEARFEYDDAVEAALGPFANIDRVDLTILFNG